MLQLGTEVAKKLIIKSMTPVDVIVAAEFSTYISHFVQNEHQIKKKNPKNPEKNLCLQNSSFFSMLLR